MWVPGAGDNRAMGDARDQPWLMRTYSGHSSAAASNELFHTNLAKGQTGLSVAFDLPTQLGYDPDDQLAAGEVGRVGVPVAHLGHMRTLMGGLPLDRMNTSMTINAPAAWLLALYVAHAEATGVAPSELRGTTQNDIMKEYLSRGTHIFPPGPSLGLTVDVIAHCARQLPRWNPVNICSYHLQEAGATPVQEIAFALADAVAVLDAVRASPQVPESELAGVVARMSFFVNAGIRFVEETCKVRAFALLWDRICRERYGVADPARRRFRYGVQVNSLGLTEAQPENNVARVVLEMLGVTLSRDARARSIQLPAWNEALGLPTPWDQQWALRMQQVLAHETDLLEYEDIFAGSRVIETRTQELADEARLLLDDILEAGGAFGAIATMKAELVRAHTERVRAIEAGDVTVVGMNAFTETEPSPLGGADAIQRVDPDAEKALAAEVEQWRSRRDARAAQRALDDLRRAADGTEPGTNIMVPSIACARMGVTTGEWARALREVFGEYRAPTGVPDSASPDRTHLGRLAANNQALPGGPPRILVAKPGLDGHSNGAEQLAVAARDAGMEVIYQGIRSTTARVTATAVEEDVDLVGLSMLSGSHLQLVPEIIRGLRAAGVTAPVVVGGIVPEADHEALRAAGVARIYTPADYELAAILEDLSELVTGYRS